MHKTHRAPIAADRAVSSGTDITFEEGPPPAATGPAPAPGPGEVPILGVATGIRGGFFVVVESAIVELQRLRDARENSPKSRGGSTTPDYM
jgi:hypothetical protein